MKRKKGFTLVELIVAIACSSIVLLGMVSSVYFLYKMNDKVLSDSSINYNISKVKDQILDNEYFDESKFEVSNKSLLYDGKVISSGVEIVGFDIEEKVDRNNNTFTYCTIQYNNSEGLTESINFIIK